MQQNNLSSGKQIVMRLVEQIKRWEGWKIYDRPLRALILLFGFTFTLPLVTEPHPLLLDSFFIITGLLGTYVLYHIIKPYFVWIWMSEVGKFAIGFFSLVVIAIARVLADYQIVTTTGVPASLFPRAQDVLTLLFSALMWFNMGIIILGLSILVSQIGWFFFSRVGRSFRIESAKARGNIATKIFTSGSMVLFMFSVMSDKIKRMKFNILEHAIVWSSFVQNTAVPFHLIPPALGPRATGYPVAFQLCSLQPNDAWVALVKDDAVMVALPATPKEMRSAFTYLWGKCGDESPR